jgi:hypothetical protein
MHEEWVEGARAQTGRGDRPPMRAGLVKASSPQPDPRYSGVGQTADIFPSECADGKCMGKPTLEVGLRSSPLSAVAGVDFDVRADAIPQTVCNFVREIIIDTGVILVCIRHGC